MKSDKLFFQFLTSINIKNVFENSNLIIFLVKLFHKIFLTLTFFLIFYFMFNLSCYLDRNLRESKFLTKKME